MGARFSAPVQTGPEAHPAFCTIGTVSFPGVKSGQGGTLTPHLLLVPWSRNSRAIPVLSLWAVRPVQSLSAWTKVRTIFLNKWSSRRNHLRDIYHPEDRGRKFFRKARTFILQGEKERPLSEQHPEICIVFIYAMSETRNLQVSLWGFSPARRREGLKKKKRDPAFCHIWLTWPFFLITIIFIGCQKEIQTFPLYLLLADASWCPPIHNRRKAVGRLPLLRGCF